MTKQSILTGKCAEALINNLKDCGFSDSLTYRTRAHALNNQKVEEAVSLMTATIALHKQNGMTADAAALRFHVTSISKVRSKDAMNFQIDDLLNFLMGWVRAGELTAEREEEQQAPAVEEKVEGLAPVACTHTPQLVAMAKDSKAGLEVRITKLSNALNTMSEKDLEQFLIVSPLVAVAYGLIDGRYASHTDLTIAPGFQSRSVALSVCGPDHVVKTRREVLETALMSSQEAHTKLSEFLAKEPVETTTELKPSAAWLAQQERGE